MSQSIRTIGLSSLFLLIFTSSVMQTAAETTQAPVVFSAEEKSQHLAAMSNMSEEQRLTYRNEQYQILRQRAAQIGYEMPEAPPWNQAPAAQADVATYAQPSAAAPVSAPPVTTRSALDSGDAPAGGPQGYASIESRHQEQLDKYRKAAAEKRQAMQDRLEKQRQSVQDRIARLVEKNGVKPGTERVAPTPPAPPAPPAVPAVPAYSPPAMLPRGPVYQPYYRMPPPAYPGYY